MKNLCLCSVTKTKTADATLPEVCCISMDTLYVVVKHKVLAVQSRGVRHVCDLLQIPQLQENQSASPVHMDVCEVTGHLIICFVSGDLVSVNTDDGTVEYVGCVDPGIAAASWSPGGILFAVVTLAFNLVLLSQDLEPLVETELRATANEQLVSVGWGKKETQFRGSEGKIKAETGVQEVTSRYDDGRVRVSWRGDGECLVVSFLEDGVRHLKVFSTDGTLLHSNEPTPGLESALCWRPNGSVIASTQKLPNKHLVCFFEKNLLSHGGFSLREECTVQDLIWNCDSSILAVVMRKAGVSETVVKFYTVSNYHWYHKFSLLVPEDETTVFIDWDREDACTLHLVTSTDRTLTHTRWMWRWAVDSSSSGSEDDQAWVAVVDGPRLLLTAFKRAVVPPPMSSSTLEVSNAINAVGFLQFGAENEAFSSNALFIQCADGSLEIFQYSESEKRHMKVTTGKVTDCILFQATWVTPDRLLACGITPSGSYQLLVLDISRSGSDGLNILRKPLSEPLLAIRRVPGSNVALIWHQSQSVKALDIESLETRDWLEPVPRGPGRLLAVEVRDKVFMLDTAHRLYANDEIIASNVTSFRVTISHFLATTLQHKLLCWPLSELTITASERVVERGARILTAVRGTSSVVLQLPRGNLEVVLPRALTITTLKTLLDGLHFSEAQKLMRRERVNLNLLYDHNPRNFESNVKLFVSSITDPILLCTFIAELVNENVTQTLYSTFYPKSERDVPGKVQLICSLLLSTFECQEDKEKLLLPKLSCLVKKGDTEGALVRVQSILAAEKMGSHGPVSSSEGLTHILYLVDVEQLFKIALGTYDLSLVMFIASKSQKDPKEYLPFLSGLQKMEENYQKFTIDNFLKRYKKALSHLALCPDRVAECLDFVVKHSLYRAALRMFAQDTDTWKAVCVQYGAELTRQSRHEEAGLLLQRAGEMLLAQHAFSRAGAWRKELACAEALRTPEDQKVHLFRSMVDSLLTARRYVEAARLLLDHIGDVEAGVSALCSAHQYDEAMRVAALRGFPDLVTSLVRPAAISARDAHEQSITEASDNFQQHLNRLREVRQVREVTGPVDWDDTASESSRGSSRGSSHASSMRSAKNTRKLERNLMKKGGVFEEVALVAALHDIISQTVALKSQVRALNLALVSLDQQTIATRLQNILETFLNRIKNDVGEIWPAPNAAPNQGATSNSIAAAFTASKCQLPKPVQALQPKVMFTPDLCNSVEWKLDILLDF